MTFQITIDWQEKGTIHEVSFGSAARSAMLNLGITEAEQLTITRATDGVKKTFYDCFLDSQTALVYEWIS